jgi:hypothetical protein
MLCYPPQTPSSALITTTRASSNAIAYGTATIDAATITEDVRIYYPSVAFGGPRADNPYCQYPTTIDGEQPVANASLIHNQYETCNDYPYSVTSDAPVNEAPVPTPVTITGDGRVPVSSAYRRECMTVYNVQMAATLGYSGPSTVLTPLPTRTALENHGNGQCGTSDGLSKQGSGEACDRAVNVFDAKTGYRGTQPCMDGQTRVYLWLHRSAKLRIAYLSTSVTILVSV